MVPIDECPYGASDCPKIESLRKVLDKNTKDIEQINTNIVELTTTIRNAAFIVGIIITVLAALIGAYVI